MVKQNKLILVSTFRHFYMSLGLAFSNPSISFHLVFIDQNRVPAENKVFTAASILGFPFASIDCLPVKLECESKIVARHKGFKRLGEILLAIKPTEIITGNDRRIEFQYSMNFLSKVLNTPVVGAFIDDGTGSYISFQRNSKIRYFTDKYIDTPIKKILYGCWYSRPEVFGGSAWVDVCYLAHPELSPRALIDKKHVDLKREYYIGEIAKKYFSDFSCLLDGVVIPKLSGGVLFILPHTSMIKTMYGSNDKLKRILISAASKYSCNIYYKYHPRELGDPLSLSGLGTQLTSSIPAELYFSIMNFDLIIGDVSTALMAAKWLLPNADVRYLPVATLEGEQVAKLFKDLKIESMNIGSIV